MSKIGGQTHNTENLLPIYATLAVVELIIIIGLITINISKIKMKKESN